MKKTSKTGDKQPHEASRTAALLEKRGNMMVLLTIASVVLSTIVGIGVLSPLLHTAAVFPFFYTAMKRRDHRWSVIIVFRWALALFATIVVLGVFVPGRVGTSLPLAEPVVRTIDAWVKVPGSSPPAGLPYLLWGMALFLVGSVVSGGLIGFLVGSVAVGGAAYGALFIFRHGFNIIQVALVAVPLWQLSLFVAGGFILVPASQIAYERFLNVERDPNDWPLLRNCMYIGAGFFVLSLVFRYATAGPWRSLLERWTVL
ncbi:MAG: hypothetical protein JSW50_00770 [Candidatus Latescibacterota bacterium]|nr:MAG: hypothetical protein JSW50_00770 [Candidatus Latescibacterota bacterium]